MSEEKKDKIDILFCPVCKSTGYSNLRVCPECRGRAMATVARGRMLYWGYPLTRYHLNLARARRIFNKIRWVTVLLVALNFWFWTAWRVFQSKLYLHLTADPSTWINFYWVLPMGAKLLFWLGVLSFTYLFYRSLREKKSYREVERHDYNHEAGNDPTLSLTGWRVAAKWPRRKSVNMAETYTDEALAALGDAYRLADKLGHATVTVAHLFYALLSSSRISNIFIRLGLPASVIKKRVEGLLTGKGVLPKDAYTMPLAGDDLLTAIFKAYNAAYEAHQEYVSVTELLLAAESLSPALQDLLFDFNINKQKMANVVEWARIREKLYRQYQKFRRAAGHRSKKGMDKAMTALATPYLNRFSDDLTLLAQLGHLDQCVARDKEIEELFRAIEGGGQSVIMVGEHGTGKKSILEGIAERMIEDDVPRQLKDKRLVRMSVSALLAGTTPAGAVERLIRMMNEIARARNVVLFIHNLHELTGVSAGGQSGSLDVAGTLAEYLAGGRFITIATTTPDEYSRHVSGGALANIFSKVEVREMDENQAIQVLESKVGIVEYKQKVFFAYDAIEKAVQFSSRFMHDITLPGSALEVMAEAASFARNKKGGNSLVTAEDVAQVVSEKTHVPLTTVSADESSKLMRLEEEMHKRVVGQDEAVEMVANALRRARAEIRSTKRPIANFLFMGPTGVGKTELAKTIAEVYFGGEDKVVRLDMSEYQEKSGVGRLIGSVGEKGSGILTEAVRRNPFTLLLLDEIEKADKDILNLFLQVMDDGRLTDSVGRVTDFTNVIIIATTNAGTAYVQEQMRAGLSGEAIKERLLHGELAQYFRPEFLNRFDGIVLFKALTRDDIKKIAGFMLRRVAKDLEAKGIMFEVEDSALDFLSDVGFDPEFGARPMRRALQERVENKLAEMLLAGKLKRKDTVVLGAGGEIRVK